MAKSLFIKKSVKALLNEAQEKRHSLQRTLGAINLTAIGIGAIIGAGIFVLTGQAAAEYAGPGITISFIFAGIIALFSALCYAEFASLIPVSGSAYSYAYVTMGEFPAWIIGWALVLEYLVSSCTVAVGWSGYFTSLLGDFGIHIPAFLSSSPFIYDVAHGWQVSGSLLNLPALCVVGLIGYLIATGIKTAASVNNVLVVVKLAVVALFIVCGIGFIKADNLTPFIPENTGVFGQFGWSGILRASGVVFFAFIGFDALSTVAQEAKDPQKDLPKGMLGSLLICTLSYILVSLILVGIVSYTKLNVADPIAVAVDALGSKFLWLSLFIKLAIIAGLTSVTLVMLLGQTRIFYTMANDGLLPKSFGKVSDKHHTPVFTTAIVTIVAMVIAGLFPVGILGQLVSMATLLAFALVNFGVLILRYKQPSLHRPFKVPLVPWIPLAGTIACFGQMILLPGVTWVQLIGWLVLGGFIYFAYGIKHSKVRGLQLKKK